MWGKSGGAHGYLVVSLFTFCSNCFASVTIGNQNGISVWFYSVCTTVRNMSSGDRMPVIEFWFYSAGLGDVIWAFKPLFQPETWNNWPTYWVVVRIRGDRARKALSVVPATEQPPSGCYLWQHCWKWWTAPTFAMGLLGFTFKFTLSTLEAK